ncbi:mersacidin/lichenicidin family type 2 lantibiotic [Nostoc sp. CCY0012]|uniref:mersacidin/lichenicidin family type 2 lantibiotic n=1 Tax=Nostoc sp. CCY0012 TaxID=1056123 RepID=UPI0039C6E9A6
MSNIDIVRAWKDEDYRNSLSEEQRSQLPENPAGIVELSDKEMEVLGGGAALVDAFATEFSNGPRCTCRRNSCYTIVAKSQDEAQISPFQALPTIKTI